MAKISEQPASHLVEKLVLSKCASISSLCKTHTQTTNPLLSSSVFSLKYSADLQREKEELFKIVMKVPLFQCFRRTLLLSAPTFLTWRCTQAPDRRARSWAPLGVNLRSLGTPPCLGCPREKKHGRQLQAGDVRGDYTSSANIPSHTLCANCKKLPLPGPWIENIFYSSRLEHLWEK